MDGLIVVAKRKNKYYTGGIKAGKFVRYREVKKLSDLRRRDDYVTLAAYLKAVGNKEKSESILARLKVERLYILMLEKPQDKTTTAKGNPTKIVGEMTPKAWEKVYWAKFHPYCLKCAKDCKQSAMALSVYCPSKTSGGTNK